MTFLVLLPEFMLMAARCFRPRLESLEERSLPATCLTEFALPEVDSRPTGLVAGSDGNLWFTEASQTAGNHIGRLTPRGEITRFALPQPASQPTRITVGPEGSLWFTEFAGNRIGRITPAGSLVEFAVPTPASEPNGIVTGPDGNLWFTENAGNRIGRITPQGEMTEFPIPTAASRPGSIVRGPDGNLWFAEVTGNRLGRITPTGVITEFELPKANSSPSSLTVGPDGNLWYTGFLSNRIGRLTTRGAFTEYVIPQPGSRPNGIVAGPDGRLWFTQAGGAVNGIAALQVDGRFDRQVRVPTDQASPAQISVGPDENLWFTELTGSRIGVVHVDATIRLVRRLYERVLDRPAALSEQEYWRDGLLGRGAHAVTEGIDQAPEARSRLVQSWFRTYLERAPLPAEESWFVTAFQAGLTEEQVLGSFFGSTEHAHRAPQVLAIPGAPPSAVLLVRSLYRQLLGREPQPPETVLWTDVLAARGQTALATDLLQSEEYRQGIVRGYYHDWLARAQEPTAAEVQGWIATGLDLRGIRTRMAASQEFYEQGLAQPQHCYVQALYGQVLERDAAPAEGHYWTSVLLQQGSLAVAQGIEQSSEARTHRVEEWYAHYLGRSADAAGRQFFVNVLAGGAAEEPALALLLASPEYGNRTPQLTGSTAATDEVFVQALYQQLLGRTGSDADLAFWMAQLAGRGRAGIGQAFLESAEYRTRVVASQYEDFLKRQQPAAEAEIQFWVRSDMDLLGLRLQFRASPEYYGGR